MNELPASPGDERDFQVRRILAALGPGNVNAGILEGAVELAERFGAELEILFIEDTMLLQWSQEPFVRQISLHALSAAQASAGELELQFRAVAMQAKQQLSSLVGARGIRSSFRVARGRMAVEVKAASAGVDLLVVGSGVEALGRSMIPQRSVRAMIAAVSVPVMLLPVSSRQAGWIHVLPDDIGEARKLIDVAMAFNARYTGGGLVTIWLPEPVADAEVKEALGARSQLRIRTYDNPETVLSAIGAGADTVVVISARSIVMKDPGRWGELARIQSRVLVVR